MEKIKIVRSLLNDAFRQDNISKRNKMILEASKALNELEKDKTLTELVKSLRESYSRELIENLQPTNIKEDSMSLLALISLNSDFGSVLERYPILKVKYERFLESLRSDVDFLPLMNSLKQLVKE